MRVVSAVTPHTHISHTLDARLQINTHTHTPTRTHNPATRHPLWSAHLHAPAYPLRPTIELSTALTRRERRTGIVRAAAPGTPSRIGPAEGQEASCVALSSSPPLLLLRAGTLPQRAPAAELSSCRGAGWGSHEPCGRSRRSCNRPPPRHRRTLQPICGVPNSEPHR